LIHSYLTEEAGCARWAHPVMIEALLAGSKTGRDGTTAKIATQYIRWARWSCSP